jgi:hypothetical protein
MTIFLDDYQSHQNLVYAVVATAMRDTFRPPINNRLDHHAETAMSFLFSNDVDPWLELVDMDASGFKKRLQDSMWGDNRQIPSADRRVFRINYKLWQGKTNFDKLKALGYEVNYK